MNAFIIFRVLTDLCLGGVGLFVGFFLLKKFKKDVEYSTIGGTLCLTSLIFLIMAFRVLLQDLGLIDRRLAFYIFLFEYPILFFLLAPYALPRFLFLVFNSPLLQKIALTISSIFYFVYLAVHFIFKEKTVFLDTPQGLVFVIPSIENIFLSFIFILLFPLMILRTRTHFLGWRKGKTSPYRFFVYLLMFFSFFLRSIYFGPTISIWLASLGDILIVGVLLGIYFFASQELLEKAI
jgi:hypothetical protein